MASAGHRCSGQANSIVTRTHTHPLPCPSSPAQRVPKVDALGQLAAHHTEHHRPATAAVAGAKACQHGRSHAASLDPCSAGAARCGGGDAAGVTLQAVLHLACRAGLPEHALACAQLAQQAALLPPASTGGGPDRAARVTRWGRPGCAQAGPRRCGWWGRTGGRVLAGEGWPRLPSLKQGACRAACLRTSRTAVCRTWHALGRRRRRTGRRPPRLPAPPAKGGAGIVRQRPGPSGARGQQSSRLPTVVAALPPDHTSVRLLHLPGRC